MAQAAFRQGTEAWSWLMGHLLYINMFLSIVIVFFQRRDPKAVWTWLLLLYPGIRLFLLLDFRPGLSQK